MFRIAARRSGCTAARVLAQLELPVSISLSSWNGTGSNSSPQTIAMALEQRRFLSSRPSQQQQQWRPRQKPKGPLLNEHLVSFLLNKSKSSNANEIEVRLVVTTLDGGNSKPEVVSLMKAVEVSTELGVDLVGINVDQNPPVIKAQDYGKLAYQTEKGSSSKSGNSKPVKEFKFKGTIAEHDLARKVDDVVKYLKKGHNCQIQIRANGFARRKDPNIVENLWKRVQEEVVDLAIPGKIKTNPEKSQVNVLLQTTGIKAEKLS